MSTQNNTCAPRLRFPGFTGEWKEKKLGEITNDIYQPQTISKEQFTNTGYPVYGANGIIGFYDKYNHETDQILVTCRGASCGTINFSKGKCWITGNAMVVNLDKVISHYNKQFFYYLLENCDLNNIITGSGQPQIVRTPLLNLRILVPPTIAEQKKIAECLADMDSLIDAQSQNVDALKEQKVGLMQQLFPQNDETTPRLRFPGFEGEWEVRTLGEIAIKINRRNSRLEITRVLTNSANAGIVDQSSYFDREIAVKDNTANYHIVELDDFVYNPRISTAAPVGPISINKIGRGIMSPLYTVFKIHTGCISFFELYFQTSIWHSYLKSIANFGARFDRMNITTEGFFNMPLLLPTIEEQLKIAECLSALDEQIAAETTKLEALRDHKKGLMQQLFPQPSK